MQVRVATTGAGATDLEVPYGSRLREIVEQFCEKQGRPVDLNAAHIAVNGERVENLDAPVERPGTMIMIINNFTGGH